ncbi:hypothetical protein R1sor_010761 [Riccia sorocarpa]|uniref:EF-hand domain-containing protein n=1 Tax=Riccia sorocarpa TaxID=122646 RepID=A0ABD3I2L0_9MARC
MYLSRGIPVSLRPYWKSKSIQTILSSSGRRAVTNTWRFGTDKEENRASQVNGPGPLSAAYKKNANKSSTILRWLTKTKAPSKDDNPFAEYFSVDASLCQNSKSESPPSSSPSNSYPSSKETPSLSSASLFSSPASSSASSVVSSARSSSSSSSPNSPRPVNTPPAAWHSRMITDAKQTDTTKGAMVDHILDLENDKLTEAFRIIDSNGDGKISEEELGAMWKRLGEKISQKELRLMIQEADKNGDGVLDLEEFIEFFSGMVVHPEIDDPIQHADDIRLAFDLSAFAHDGLISAAELQTLMRKIRGKKVSAADCAAMIRFLDSDGDGLITFTEFQKLMTSTFFSSNF